MSDEEANEWESNTEREFKLWANSQHCDIRKTQNFVGIQDLVFRQTLENGEVFVLLPRRGPTPVMPYSLRVQLIESDRICNPDNKPDSEKIVAGVERDEDGAPIAYHILNKHPGNLLFYGATSKWEKVSAFGEKTGLRNVLHPYVVKRPGQTRGIPFLAPVIETIKQITRYTEAEIMGALVSGFFTVFIKSETGMGLGSMIGEGTTDTSQASTDEEIKLGNGAVVSLRPGESIESADPSRPNSNFDAFLRSILQQVGIALEIPFEVLIGHFSASYSASRAALLEAWRFFRGRRFWLASVFCQPVYESFLYEAVSIGRIRAPGFFANPVIRQAYCGAIWVGDAPSQIDPMKEVEAAGKRVELGFSTMDEETVALTGGDFETNYPKIVKERKMMEEAGMWIDAKKKANPQLLLSPAERIQKVPEGTPVPGEIEKEGT
jgi:lambda family phage portal protein